MVLHAMRSCFVVCSAFRFQGEVLISIKCLLVNNLLFTKLGGIHSVLLEMDFDLAGGIHLSAEMFYTGEIYGKSRI